MSARETAFLIADPRQDDRWTPPGYFVPGDEPTCCAHCGERRIDHLGRARCCPRLPLEVRR